VCLASLQLGQLATLELLDGVRGIGDAAVRRLVVYAVGELLVLLENGGVRGDQDRVVWVARSLWSYFSEHALLGHLNYLSFVFYWPFWSISFLNIFYYNFVGL